MSVTLGAGAAAEADAPVRSNRASSQARMAPNRPPGTSRSQLAPTRPMATAVAIATIAQLAGLLDDRTTRAAAASRLSAR